MENELLKGLYDCLYTPPELSEPGGRALVSYLRRNRNEKRIGIASAVTISFAPNYSGYGDTSTKS